MSEIRTDARRPPQTWGNCPNFAALGRVRTVGDRKVCTVRYTFDERIEDGLCCARALGYLRDIVEGREMPLALAAG
jgi:hypothetical protein